MKKRRVRKRIKRYFFSIIVILILVLYIIKVWENNDVKKEKPIKNNEINLQVSKENNKEITEKREENNQETTKKPVDNIEDSIKIIDGILIVNKTYSLPENYTPSNINEDIEGLDYCSTCLDKELLEKYDEMKADATSLGLNIWIQSGYRSYDYQKGLYDNYVQRDGKTAADTYSARPGHSEHQTGLAFDLNTITDDFQYTDEGKWIHNNCYRYGFILRYPKGKEEITGYKYESWHLRYVGVELATELYNDGDWITLEEHFNLTSKYNKK